MYKIDRVPGGAFSILIADAVSESVHNETSRIAKGVERVLVQNEPYRRYTVPNKWDMLAVLTKNL